VTRLTGWTLWCVLLIPAGVAGQAPTPPPGRAYLFVLDLQGTALDEFPSSITALNGVMTVVDKNGQHMLKASSPSEVLITLPQPLPADFTVELDVIPKGCCGPDDIMLEGTPTMNRGPASAQLTWHPERLSAVGGSPDMYQAAMPADLAASTPGNLTHVLVEFQGTQIKLYTNGRRLYTLDKQFARGRVLRVWLGGENSMNPMYLAGLQVMAGAVASSVIAQYPGQPGIPTPPPGVPSPASTGGMNNPQRPINPPPPPPPPATSTPTTAATRASAPGGLRGPVSTSSAAAGIAARCQPGPSTGSLPLRFVAFGIQVGGAPLQWDLEPNTRYVIERAPAPPNGGPVSWTRLASSCDPGAQFVTSTYTDETLVAAPVLRLSDVVPGVRMGLPYQYRLTRIAADGTSGSALVYWEAPSAAFPDPPKAAVSGNSVTITTGMSYCMPQMIQCNPWKLEFAVTASTSGFAYQSTQPWVDSFDSTDPYSMPGVMKFRIASVPAGTHTFAVTALYEPDFRAPAGSVTVKVP
jgi:hypothetical protein